MLSPSEVGVSSFIAGKSSMWNSLPLSSIGGSGVPWIMMASGRSTLLGGVLLGSLTGCSFPEAREGLPMRVYRWIDGGRADSVEEVVVTEVELGRHHSHL